MADRNPVEVIHDLAVEVAAEFLQKAEAAGLDWKDVAIGSESFLAMVVVMCAKLSGTEAPIRFSQEVIENVTERAHERARAFLTG